ncbi:hypothetical protein K0504_04200 [Neiella marina]|uniref:Big-1 domain-containing protein n=1 Tax=Neiella holothuriorum TaxID=2870530 RepID=A0ABS7EDA0_9GAMM|nr:hypothetical protein [Neiella holothuriorum]MBW8190230.1 hypothetical protein [Neiella holothuriorum]
MMSKWVQWSWILLVALLVGCGGGSALSEDDDDDDGGTTTETVEITLWACDSFDLSAPDLTGCSETDQVESSPPTVIFVEAESDGSAASGEKVTVAADKGVLSQSDGTVLTNTDGQGFLTITAGEDTGVVTLTASYSDASSELVATINGTPVTSSNSVSVELWDCEPSQDGCMQITNFSAASPALIVVMAQQDNNPAVNQMVTVTSSKGTLSPSDGIVLTDDSGYATLDISAGSDSGIVTVDAVFEDATDSLNATINEVQINLALTTSLADGEELADGSTIAVTATLTTDEGDAYETPVEVVFSSTCAEADTAIIDESIQSTAGTAVATYKPDGCETEDVISASVTVGSSSDLDSVVIAIADTPVGNIEFVSADPTFIYLEGSGGQTTSSVTFKVTDTNGRAKQGESVDFSLASGDDKVDLSVLTALSDSNGEVTTTVRAGSLPGSARVQAIVTDSDPVISTVSSELAIATGLPDIDSFSLSFSVHNPESWGYDGEEVDVTIRAADHFGNPVSDGTSISFITEGGAIEPSCETAGGVCTVSWTSQDPRPINARVTVLAFAEGEESFTDNNGNGLFEHDADTFDTAYDIGEAYRDDDEDGIYNNADQLIDRNSNGSYDGPDGIYNGQLCHQDSATAGTCTQDLVDVHSQGVIVMAGNAPQIKFCGWDGTNLDCNTTPSTLAGVSTAVVCAYDIAADGVTINPVAAGSEISFTPSDPLKLLGASGFEQSSTNASIVHPYLGIDDFTACSAGVYQVRLDLTDGGGQLLVELTTPKGVYTSAAVTIEL